MLEYAMKITIESLWKQGRNKSEISRVTDHDWKTVAKTIKQLEQGNYFAKKERKKKLDKYKDQIIGFMEQDLSGVRIYEKLQELGSLSSYSTVKMYISKLKKREKVCIRFHTKPGEEAQVDFGYAGRTLDNNGKKRKTWVFNMRLSYSRLDYYEKVYDQKVETFIQCHINAFNYFRGIPEYVKIDNLKAAVLEAHFYEVVYQNLYKQFADYCGFNPLPCRVRKPQEKGKTESGIKYVKNNFFAGRKFTDGKDLNKQLSVWLETTCNSRTHGTTRKVPRDLFEDMEKSKLLKLPLEDFRMPKVGTRSVYNDCHVYIEYNYYSAPSDYVGKEVEIEVDQKLVRIFHQGTQIAIHKKAEGRGKFITEQSHYPQFKDHLSLKYKELYQVKMNEIGNHAGLLFQQIIKKNPKAWNRPVCGIISLTKKFSTEVVDLSCKRALAYSVLKYSGIKNICKSGAYNLPIDMEDHQ